MLIERSLRLAGGPADEEHVEATLAAFLDHYREHLLDRTRPYPGIPSVVRRLRDAGVVLTVATNKPAALAHDILEGLDLAPSFAALVGGDSLPTRKPDPAPVYVLAERTGVPLAATLLVGDSLVDLATARAARVHSGAVGWGLTPRETLLAAGPDHFAAEPDDLLAIVS